MTAASVRPEEDLHVTRPEIDEQRKRAIGSRLGRAMFNDFVTEFGAKLPGWAFFKNVLGVPIDDLDMLVDCVERGTFEPPEERAGHFARIFEYLGNYLKIRKDEPPRGDLVDVIAAGVTYE